MTFEREYRCFCRDGRFFCGSSFPIEPYLPVPGRVRGFVETAAARLLAHGSTMVTVDVGVGPDGALRLVELGGVNSWASTARTSPTSSPRWKPRPSPAR
ncbi:ATP-grasp domain-containing protein [Nocardia xishanensis]